MRQEIIHTLPSLKRIIETNTVIGKTKRGLPYPGGRPDQIPFWGDLQRINRAYIEGNEVYSMGWDIPDSLIAYNSGNGSPLLQKAFYPAIQEAIENLSGTEISQYAYASGDKECRRRVAEYLYKEGFRSNSSDRLINENQLIFFNSTTEAFSLLMKVICRPSDVVLFAAPTYGLLAYAPERVGAVSKIIPLAEEDNWLINPEKLEKAIKCTNKELSSCDKYSYTPCVTAFVNINPNNPTGRVMGKDEVHILERVNEVCKENAVFVIDDIIYRDLCFDMNNRSIPIAFIEGAFSNTITLFGTSKSFGLAGARAGVVLADECIIRGLRNEVFQLMDSTSLVVSHLLAGSFNDSKERHEYYHQYFEAIISKYMSNWNLMKVLVDGECENCHLDEEDKSIIDKYFTSDATEIITSGIKELKFAGNITPEAGFFALVDFSSLLGYKDAVSDTYLKSEIDILYYFFRAANVKLLTGDSFAWPVGEQVVARMSFAYEKEDLVRMMYQIFSAIKKLDSNK